MRGRWKGLPVQNAGIRGVRNELLEVARKSKYICRLKSPYKPTTRVRIPATAPTFFPGTRDFVTIHPFADGNGRISRLIMNFVLNKQSLPMLNIPYKNRNSYYNALERSQVKRQDSIFLQWLFKRYVKEDTRYI